MSTAAIAAVAIFSLTGAGSALAEEIFSASDAATALQQVDPTAVGKDPAQQAATAPEVNENSDGFTVAGATVDATIPKDAEEPIVLESSSGDLKIEPQGTSEQASGGLAVNDGAAVVYANTGTDSDTAAVPTEKGVETFTSIRSADAAEDYSVVVDLPGEEEVRQESENSAVIIDPTPAGKPSADTLPDPADAGTPAGDKAREASGMDTPDPDPRAEEKVTDGLDQAGADKPQGVPDSDIQEVGKPTQQQADALAGAPPEGVAAGEPTKEDVKDAIDPAKAEQAVEEAGEHAAEKSLETITAGATESSVSLDAANRDSTQDQQAIVARVEAPASIDADGNKVPTKLVVEGDTITMHVDHQDAEVAYPIAADPDYELIPTRWSLQWYPAVTRQETYISHWAMGSHYIGNWHPVFCHWGWVRCGYTGLWSFWSAWEWNGNHNLAWWPTFDWGPIWRSYWYPVYATRTVVVKWAPYIAVDWSSSARFAVFTEAQEEDEPGDEADFDDNGVVAYAAARRRPNCKKLKHERKVPGFGSGTTRSRVCFNSSRFKTALDSQYDNRTTTNDYNPAVVVGGGRFIPEVLANRGHPRGAFNSKGYYKIEGEVDLPALPAVNVTLQTVNYGTVMYYTGNTCYYGGDSRDRKKKCGPDD